MRRKKRWSPPCCATSVKSIVAADVLGAERRRVIHHRRAVDGIERLGVNAEHAHDSKRTPDEWVVFDMAAYAILTDGIENAPRVSADAVQNYVNLAIDGLNKSYTLPKDRAKAEIIMGVLGIDTEALYPVNSATVMNSLCRR